MMSNSSIDLGEMPSSPRTVSSLPSLMRTETVETPREEEPMRERGSDQTVDRRSWRHGPSWRSVALVLIVIGVAAIVAGFDASFYAEYGGRTGSERAITCTPREDGPCSNPALIERQAEREPRLMSKLDSVGSEVALAGVILLVIGLVAVGAAIGSTRALRSQSAVLMQGGSSG
jgi:hypothetical protein